MDTWDKNNLSSKIDTKNNGEMIFMPPLNDNQFDEKPKEQLEIQENELEEDLTLPPTPTEIDPFCGEIDGLTYWGFSQCGESHIKNGIPCQDSCKVVVSKKNYPIIIAAIADGVGSCALSHYGAAIAVDSSTSYLKEIFDNNNSDEFEDKWIEDTLRSAMNFALQAVKNESVKMEQLEYSFQSTLTIAVFYKNILYIYHIGDDGVVALTEDGNAKLVTSRIKGDEANSVYPLQAGDDHWEFSKIDKCVNGFVMATDGILDAFVGGKNEGNRIYYPFIQPAFDLNQEKNVCAKEIMNFYHKWLLSPEQRLRFTDDLTMVVVSDQNSITKDNLPVFDKEVWDSETKEFEKKLNEALYPQKVKESTQFEGEEKKTIKTAENEKGIKTCRDMHVENDHVCPHCGKSNKNISEDEKLENKTVNISRITSEIPVQKSNIATFNVKKKLEPVFEFINKKFSQIHFKK